MAWNGYLALGTTTGGSNFTESTATGYARQAFTLRVPHNGRMQGSGAPVAFPTATSAVVSYNAFAFFTASSGGTAILVYPMHAPSRYGAGASLSINPYGLAMSVVDCQTTTGLPLDPGGVQTLAGTEPTAIAITSGTIDGAVIGGVTPAAGTFTTLTATGSVALSPASLNVVISPTGTGLVTINPATASAMDNVVIGGGTPLAGAFTTLAASSTVSGTGFSTYLASPPAIGGSAAAAGSFTTLAASGAVSGAGITALLASPSAIGGTAPAAGAFTTLSATGAVSGVGFSTYLASPPVVGGTTPAAGSFTTANLGVAGSVVGTLAFANGTSGTISLSPPTGALGTVTLSLPDATDTLVGKATTDVLTNKTITDFIASGTKRVTAQVDVSSSTTLVAVTGLSVALTAGATYAVHVYLPLTVTATPGIKIALDTGSTLTATSINFMGQLWNGATISAAGTSTALATPAVTVAAAGTFAVLDGVIVVNAAGTLVVKIAQNTSNATNTSALVNGYMSVTRIA